MIKKILFIAFIIFLSILISNLLAYNSEVIVNFFDYQITTKTSFLMFLLIIFVLILYLLTYLSIAILYPNANYYKKNEKKFQKRFNQYLELITEAFIYKSARNIKESFKKLKKANKIFKETNLSKLLESQLYYLKKEYQKSEESFNEIKNTNLNLNLINLKINLEKAKKVNDIDKIKEYSEQILKIEPINKASLECIFDIYINNKEWEKAYEILQRALKSKIFDKDKIQNKILFVYTALGKKYYDNQKFMDAKYVLRLAYKSNSNYVQTVILLIQTYIALGKKSKALEIIKKTWKHNTNPKLAELYFSLLTEKEEKSIKSAEILYKLNSKSYESNLILARAYYQNEIYSKARKYAKMAEEVNETKSLYELMLKIEQEDNGSSALINNLKNKILTLKNSCWKCNICKREYINWQPECNNCKSLNSLEWAE